MAVFEVQGPDGKTYEVQANSAAEAAKIFASVSGASAGGSSTNSAAVADFANKGGAMLSGIHNGMTFGLGDNLQGVKSAVMGQTLADGRMGTDFSGTMGERYQRGVEQARALSGAAQEAEPMMYGAGNIAGAAITALAASPFTGGSSFMGMAGRGAVAGAIEGGLHGAGNADGVDVLSNAMTGGAIGAGAGALAPALVAGVGGIARGVANPITGAVESAANIANPNKANRAVGRALQSSGKTRDEIAAMLARAASQGQPEFRMMDAMGVAGQRQASGIARQGGDAATEIAEFLESRQLGQGERIGGFIDDAFGTKGTTAAKTKDSLTAARGRAADAAYGAARGNAAPVDVRGALGVIDTRIGGMQGAGIAGDSIDGKLAGYRARLAGNGAGLGDGVTGAELSDFDRVLGLKQSIQDDIGAAVRAGRNNEARELGKLSAELDAALEASSDMYRTANDGFREASRAIDAVDTGAMMASRGRAADNVPAFQGMTPPMQSSARVGYGDNLLNRLEAVTAPTANRAKALQSPKRAAEADAMTIDPALYRDRLGRENTMWNTQNRALGGSRTADNQADMEAMNLLSGDAMGVARSAANLQFGDTVARIGAMIGPMVRGESEATRQLIARALMSGNAAALDPVLRQMGKSEATRAKIAAMLREPLREVGRTQFAD